MRLSARGTVKKRLVPRIGWLWVSLYPALIVNWLTSPGGTRHRINKVHFGDERKEKMLNVAIENQNGWNYSAPAPYKTGAGRGNPNVT